MRVRSTVTLILVLAVGLSLVACGHDHGSSKPIVTQILSDALYDGDIALGPSSSATYTVTQGNSQSVFAGIDPVTLIEYRTFLDFPLGGSNGVPLDAVIDSATLDIYINSIDPYPLSGTIPIRIDLVSFQPPYLVGTDFDRSSQPALMTKTINPPISQTDFGNHVYIDVTQMMVEVQRLGLADFQVRIMEDLGLVSPGIIEINDTTGSNRNQLAPLLEVSYY